jgi:regulatory protein
LGKPKEYNPKKLLTFHLKKTTLMSEVNSVKEAIHKIEHFCAYQERCHDEVMQKLRSMKMDSNEIDEILAHLIQENYLNESRFACSFARGKHRIKFWGKVRIVNELKFRNISTYNINLALKEITAEEYEANFNALAERNWHAINEANGLKKRKKCCDFLLLKGYESNLVYEKVKELEAKIK